MKEIHDVPAFPTYDILHDAKTSLFVGLGTKSEGMSLRDYFAGQALAVCIRNDFESSEELARWAYNIADAMLAERERSKVGIA